MTLHLKRRGVQLHHGDCLDVLRELPDESIDAVVTDPPYGLANTSPAQVADTIVRWVNGDRDYLPSGAGFMGKAWDAFVPPVAVWDECLRVLKPGGHVLAFAGSRTHDLMTLGLRLAGFDIRDAVAWLYGSGFPKSMDVSKAIERELSRELSRELEFTAWMRTTGVTSRQIDEATGTNMGGHYLTAASQPAIPTAELMDKMRPLLPEVPEWIEAEIRDREAAKAESRERNAGARFLQALGLNNDPLAVERDEAKEWEGWGTALKPAFEPIVVGRKPLVGTVAANVLAHGTGALNIDGCRVGDEVRHAAFTSLAPAHGNRLGAPGTQEARRGTQGEPKEYVGRWPANVVLDESQAAVLDKQSGELTSGKMMPTHTTAGVDGRASAYGADRAGGFTTMETYGDTGGASRFFYVAKADASERVRIDGVAHPTVKPVSLMRWLVRLVTPPGGTILEPFAGSGTTVEACVLEGFQCVAIERETEYLPLIEQRVARRLDPVAAVRGTGEDGGLFDLLGEDVS